MARGRKPVVQCTRSEWVAMTRRMATSCPPPEGYRWLFVWSSPAALIADDAGGTIVRREAANGRPGTLTVRVERGESLHATLGLLIHEVAHAFDIWTHHGWAADHSATWGVWYARVYCRYWGIS